MKKRICIIFTGGTIGSATDGGIVHLSGGSKKLLIDLYKQKYGDDVEFTTLSPVNMLSENVQPENLKALYYCVRSVSAEDFDGVIITHGTDTLCFTANYLSQVLCDFPLPVVLVSALYPLRDRRSNGLENFAAAINFIGEGLSGVYVSFKNPDEKLKIHLASRLTFSDQLNGHYHSVLCTPFAEVEGNKIIYVNSPVNPAPEKIKKRDCSPLHDTLCTDIMLITARSLFNFGMYDFSRVKPKAVIIELYHSGTVCTKGDKLNFINFATYCKEQGVPLVIAPLSSKADVYGSMSGLPDNVIPCYDLSLEMCIVKVMLAAGAGKSADAFFNVNCFFEKLDGAL